MYLWYSDSVDLVTLHQHFETLSHVKMPLHFIGYLPYSSFIRHFLNIYTVTAMHLNCMYA
jgi:hypothetical protein